MTPANRRRELVKQNRLLVRQEGLAERDLAKVIATLGTELAAIYHPGAEAVVLERVDTAEPAIASVLEKRLKQTALIFGDRTLTRLEGMIPKSYYPVPPGRGPVRGRDELAPDFPRDGLNRMLEGKNARELFEQTIIRWVQLHALQRAKTVVGTIREVVRGVLLSANDEGLGEAATAKAIRERIGKRLSASNAARIARTEMHTAMTVGSDEAARSTGLEMVKEWVAAEDGRTRPSHAEADGDEVPLDQPFSVGDASLMIPGDPSGPAKEIINCRCAVFHHPVIGGEVIR